MSQKNPDFKESADILEGETESSFDQSAEELSTEVAELPSGSLGSGSGLRYMADLSEYAVENTVGRAQKAVHDNAMKIGGSIAGISVPIILAPSKPEKWVSEDAPHDLRYQIQESQKKCLSTHMIWFMIL